MFSPSFECTLDGLASAVRLRYTVWGGGGSGCEDCRLHGRVSDLGGGMGGSGGAAGEDRDHHRRYRVAHGPAGCRRTQLVDTYDSA